MPKLIIDDQEIEVPQGTKVIDAAERLGIIIPRFCYHPALKSVGACRVCAVKFLQGPFKGVQMSCMIDAQDEMVVSTTDPEAVDFRRHVLEWLMLNHPHDCPVCDEGGHCLLQDLTVACGHGMRRYPGPKRTHLNQYLGPLICHEMNRCIQCYRCSRYYQEYTGYEDLGVMQIGYRVYFGRHREGTLESPFSGNLIDICPTGVYTDKPSRYRGRRWDFERSASVCIHCSLGCHVTVNARYREVVGHEGRFSETVNGDFICDRGRYGFFYNNLPERPYQGRVDGTETTPGDAMEAARDRLRNIPADAVACIGSLRSSLETQAMLRRVCKSRGWQGPAFFATAEQGQKTKAAASRLTPERAVSLREVESADLILVVGADPLNEAPMLVLPMRQAWREGARVVVVDPRPVELPFDFDHLPVHPDALAAVLDQLSANAPSADVPDLDGEQVSALAEALKQSSRPVIVCGTDIVSPNLPGKAADVAESLNPKAGLFYLLPGANAFGAAMLSDRMGSVDAVLDAIENGSVKALVVVQNDLFRHAPDRERVAGALKRLDLLVVQDYLDSPTAKAAHVFIPSETMYESGGFFINQEGRLQRARQAARGGIPVALTGHGDHPPREFRRDIPGARNIASFQTLALIAGEPMPPYGDEIKWLPEVEPAFAPVATAAVLSEAGVRIRFTGDIAVAESAPATSASGGDLTLLTVDRTFGTEELSSLSPPLREVEQQPCLILQKEDADGLHLTDGDRVELATDKGKATVNVCVRERMARGVLVLPRHWQYADKTGLPGTGSIVLRKDQILKQ